MDKRACLFMTGPPKRWPRQSWLLPANQICWMRSPVARVLDGTNVIRFRASSPRYAKPWRKLCGAATTVARLRAPALRHDSPTGAGIAHGATAAAQCGEKARAHDRSNLQAAPGAAIPNPCCAPGDWQWETSKNRGTTSAL